jgi:hypothetical protein
VTILFVLASNTFYKHFGDALKSAIVFGDPGLDSVDDQYLATLNDSAKLSVGGGRDSLTVKEVKRMKTKQVRMRKKLSMGSDDVFRNLKYVTFFFCLCMRCHSNCYM